MNPRALTVGELADQLATLDPSLPVGVAHLTIRSTHVGLDLAASDGAVVANDPAGNPTAVWLTTQSLDRSVELQTSRPATWLSQRPCGCRIEIDISVPGTTWMPLCGCAFEPYQLTDISH